MISCFPTCDVTDGRFLIVPGGSTTGDDADTFTDTRIFIDFEVPSGASTLQIGFFDGDTGAGIVGTDGINGHWDQGTAPLAFKIYADPDLDGVDEATETPIQTFSGAGMPDNAWVDVMVNTQGNQILALVVESTDPSRFNWSAFKVRTQGTIRFAPQSFSFLGPLGSQNDANVLYPNFPNLTPTTYDGTWNFFFEVPFDNINPRIIIWDGDMDYGSAPPQCVDRDTDDPDTAPGDRPPDAGQAAKPEGIAQSEVAAVNCASPHPADATKVRPTGNPYDDDTTADGQFYRRAPSVTYELIAPDGTMYLNANPSGNREWEKFIISSDPSDVAGVTADYVVPSIQTGVWRVHMVGMDLGNVNAWRFPFPLVSPPVTLDCVAATTGEVGTPYSSNFVAGGGLPPYQFSIIAGSLPPGLTLNPTTGAITGTPTTVGTFGFTAKVVDSQGSTGTHTATVACSITISPAPVTLQCVSATRGQVGTPYSASLTAAGGVPPYTFSIIAGGLPPGLTLNPATGAITGTPTAAGTFAFTARVVDSQGTTGTHTATVRCSIKIAPPPCVPSAFTFTGSSPTSGPPGNVLTFTSGAISVKVSGWGATKGGSFSKAYLGLYSGGLGVTDSSDGNGSNNQHTVDNYPDNDYVAFAFSSPVVVDQAYLGYVVGDSDIRVWIGNIPNIYSTGITLTSSLLNGLAFTEVNTGGSSTRWADLNAPAMSGNVLVIAAKPDDKDDRVKIQKLALDCPRLLTLACPSSTSGTVGVAFSSSLVVSGGTAPYTFSIASGSLPPGLTLNSATGAITGVPTTAGTFNFKAKVVDSTGTTKQTATVNCAITIVVKSACVKSTLTFSGSTPLNGTKGNIRPFTINGVSVNVSAFSRSSAGSWATAYLGLYSNGFGVTDINEDGSNGTHRVDNVGLNNYVLFEFASPVVVDQAFLGLVLNDSDISVWIGSLADPYGNHTTLSDAVLNSLAVKEDNDTTSSADRWASFNSGKVAGNILVIAASKSDSTPDDRFKIHKLSVCK